MARAAAEFLKRWTEGFQSGRAGRVERDQRLAKESDRQGLMALNADVEALVGQTGRPLEMGEWGQLLAKHGRSMTDAEPFVRAGLFAKPQTGADLLRRQLDETRLKAEQTKLDRLVNPQPEQPTAYQQWQMSQPERPQFIPGSEGQMLKDGRAVDIPGYRRAPERADGKSPEALDLELEYQRLRNQGMAADLAQPDGKIMGMAPVQAYEFLQKLPVWDKEANDYKRDKLGGLTFATEEDRQTYETLKAALEQLGMFGPPFKTFDNTGSGAPSMTSLRVFDPATGTLR